MEGYKIVSIDDRERHPLLAAGWQVAAAYSSGEWTWLILKSPVQFEYCSLRDNCGTVAVGGNLTDPIDEKLQQLGEEGWELITSVGHENGVTIHRLKREKRILAEAQTK